LYRFHFRFFWCIIFLGIWTSIASFDSTIDAKRRRVWCTKEPNLLRR
jgi:hypothetical protein